MKNFVLPVFIGMMLMSCSTTDKEPRSSDGDFSNQLTPEEIEKAVFTPEILWKFGRVGDMQLSPDGSTVLYTVTRYDAKTDKSHTWIFSVNVAGGEPINLTEGIKESCSGPRWINNVHIAFLRKKDDRTQIWSMNADGTDVQILSDFDVDINAFGFAPDGVNLFYTRDVKLDSTVQDRYPDLPLARGMVFEDMMYRHWDSWHDYSYNHIFVSRLENGKIHPGKDIMQDEPFDSPLPPYFNTDEISWNHDGTKLAYTCKKLKGRAFSESTNSDIYIYDVNGNTRNITEGMPGYERYPVFSPDGNMVAFMSMETPGYEADQERLFIYDLTDNTKKYLTEKLDQDAAHFVWTKEGDKIYFISGLKATYQIFECNPVTGETRQVTTGTHNYTNLALHNGIMTATKGNMTMPPEVYSVDPATGKDIQLTFTNRNIYDVIRTGNIEERWIKTTDGKDMLVWVIFPPDFDPKKK